ncbi:MAG: 5'-nucleotidase C-terminal domain-containing protein [Pseudodesulfovibrio sp.]|uniref:5'-Nucleotidase domain-containing protein n=1 Tax=Pseudodesulfovibrio aespoeensis (strain ATCC 700646 / DSM 10631 / Aspo-2) TaxID=643562 RepID=E6VVM6_PSEA9|nr:MULTISPECIES: 5'-nucleotidase C-terminal domain-containing protein [Pseudodesulfovibrio]MBU4191947.1 5'-nucleotidase C-terminal domain-containing protein [Pseudomonadota bacterium]ADU63584.1 5'-Nucleotidase domain-containing protein [Pseudodesulfovibrio aespoeensis Aspo-2]MBU4243560.1 5'-nucleotidase C-terminal domain-containing protein [Pseudomonadota bacterium]MBU4378507.1 5'-nucleotidase C-terminal domain-containing protein [Pseudomonadota bacterium]MBU4475307.1 5'-nucleotidase C-termina
MRTITHVGLILLLVLALAGTAPALELTVLHVNDSHSWLDGTGDTLTLDGQPTSVRLGGWSRLARAVSDVRAAKGSVALLHAGDAVQGDLYFMKFGGRPEMELLDRLGFDAMTLGNHEFDRGSAFLAEMLEYASLPMLGANIDASAVPQLARRITPYVLLEFDGDTVGVIGLTASDTPALSTPGPVRFSDEAAVARQRVAELEARGVNKIILLTHVGLARDMELAATVPGVDLIVGGHSHSLLADPAAMKALGKTVDADYPVMVRGADGHDVPVVTAWKWSHVLGRIDVTFDDAGRVTAAQGSPLLLVADEFSRKDGNGARVPLTGADREAALAAVAASPVAAVVSEDTPTAAYIAPFNAGVASMRRQVIGLAQANLPHIRVPGTDESGLNLPHGSLLAPLVARSMLDRLAGTGSPADMALLNAGAVRHGLDQGDITVGMAYTLIPFNNTLFVLEMTGGQIRQALETGVDRGDGAFPYVAGARYVADMTKRPGQRVRDVAVAGPDGVFAPLDPARVYRVVTYSFLANGGDGYTVMNEVANRTDTGFMDAQAFIDLVTRVKTLAPPKSTGVTYIPAR